MLIAAVADDITGATDLSLMLSRAGLATVQVMGVPEGALPRAEAVVVALKSRTIAAELAVAQSVAAVRALRAAGAGQILFKYCSTFDSTDQGNIGPVAEALMDLLGAAVTIACPAFPANGRTVYQGHLFVGSQLLSDSAMKDHPLTPMRDANLVRVLGRQTALPVGLIPHSTIARGAAAVRAALDGARGMMVVDTLSDADLMVLGAACKGLPLVTGGSGIAMGLAANFKPGAQGGPRTMAAPKGRSVVLAGSCSQATRGQIAAAQAAGMASLALDALALAEGRQTAGQVVDWVTAQGGTALVYSSAEPEVLAQVQARLGREAAGALIEETLAQVARTLQATGFARFLVAGGETSGAVVAALGVTVLEIGPEIAPGVPWTRSRSPDLALALKSGNFGGPDFFLTAWDLLE